MAEYDFDLVCLGSGPAGQRAAVQAAKLGKRAAIIEKQRTIGGVCVETGTIPSKTFREAVLSFAAAGALLESGVVQPEVRPTAQQLLARVHDVIRREGLVVEDQLRRNGIAVIRGSASFLDPHTVLVQAEEHHRRVTGERILIAVGTTPGLVEATSGLDGVAITSDQILALGRLPRTMAVVGAGIIGIEYASMFAALGVEVTVVDRRERPLEFLDHEIVDELVHQMRKRRVTFRFGEAVAKVAVQTGVDGAPRALLILESGKRITTELALFSVGREGATAGLNLPAAGLAADERGRLIVDSEFRTRVPHIFAAGDVIGFPSLAATSAEQGRLAACRAFGVVGHGMAPHFPVGIYAVPEISTVGAPEHVLTRERIPYETGVARYREIARGQIVGDDSGFFKMIFHRDDGRLLGVHIMGTGATELIHIGQAVLALGAGLDYFLDTVFNYPTLAECYKVAALNAANKLRG
jgi:NAD(P) transhydrogenase